MTGNKWRLAAKSTCTTMASSFTGGIVAIGMSYYQSGGKVEVLATINGVLGALVGVTGIFKDAILFTLDCSAVF